MEHLNTWIEKNRTKVWFSILINVVVLVFMVLLMRPCYETNDDTSVAMIVNGSRGLRDPIVICQNCILGFWYTVMYAVGHGSIPWYAIFQYLVVLTSLTVVTYILFQRFKSWHAFMLTGVLLLFFGYECYIKVQYTKTAGVAMSAGVLLMFYALTKEKISKKAVFFGGFLAVLGSLYRFEEAISCCALMSGIGVFLLLELNNYTKEKRRKQFISYVVAFSCLFVCVFAAEAFDRYVLYYGDEEWAEYSRFNDLRCELMDYGTPLYKEHEEEYKSLGINKTAYKVMRNGYSFWDPDVFTSDVLESIVNMREPKTLSKLMVQNFFKEYPSGFFQIFSFYAFAVFAMGWLFWKRKGWKPIAIAVYEVIVMGGFDFYLFYTGRYLENRVEVGLWFAITLVVIWLYDRESIKTDQKTICALLLGLLIVNQNTWQERWRTNQKVIQEEIDRAYMRESLLEATEDKDALYLSKIGGITYTSYGIFDSVPEGVFENVVWYGGWEMGNPDWIHTMAKFGIRSPYADIIDRDDVYVVETNSELTVKYIKSYHKKKVKANLVKEAGYLSLYQYVSE